MRAVLGSSLRLRPALVEQMLDLQQRRDLVGRGFGLDVRSSCQRGQPGGDPLDLFAGHLLAVPDLVDDVVGRLGQELLVAELAAVCANSFCAAARSFSSRRRSAATSTVPEVSSSTTTVPRDSRTSTAADG